MYLNYVNNNKSLSDCFMHFFTLLDIFTDFRNCIKIYYVDSYLFTLMSVSIISPYLVYWSSHYHFEHIIESLSKIISNNKNYNSIIGFLTNGLFFYFLILLSTPIIGIFCTMIEILVYYLIIFFTPIVELIEYLLNKKFKSGIFIENFTSIFKIESEDANRYFIILELFYESIPQIVIQSYIFFNLNLLIGDNLAQYSLTRFDLYLSISCALLNVIINIITLCRSADKFGLSIFTYFPYFMGSKISKVYKEAIPVKNWIVSKYKTCMLGRINDFYISEMLSESIILLQNYHDIIQDDSQSRKIFIPIHVEDTESYKLCENNLNLNEISLFGQILRKLCKNKKIFIDFSVESVTIENFKDELVEFTSSPSIFWIQSYKLSQPQIYNSNIFEYLDYFKNLILGRNVEFRNENLLNFSSLEESNCESFDTFDNLIIFIIPMFDIYNCFFKPSNMISYILCMSLFSHDHDLIKLRKIIYNLWNSIHNLEDDEQKVFLLNEKVISEVFRYITIVSKNNVVDVSLKKINFIDDDLNNDEEINQMLKKISSLFVNLNMNHLPNNISQAISNIDIKKIKKKKPIQLCHISLHYKDSHVFTNCIFKIHVEHYNSLYFRLFLYRNNSKHYLNIAKNNVNEEYLNMNLKTENLWYFIKENSSDRTCNFTRTNSNKIVAINFSYEYDGFLIISNDNKYILSIMKATDVFNNYEDWERHKSTDKYINSQIITSINENVEYILCIKNRDLDKIEYIYIQNDSADMSDNKSY